MKKLILASSSPRRQALLQQVQIPFTIRTEKVDESQVKTIDPIEKVKQLAILKGKAIPLMDETEIILAADTAVSYQQTIFEKPKNRTDAFQMLSTLSGNIHDVFTGVYIRSHDSEITFVEKTEVEFWPLSEGEIEWYLATDDPYDKAGAYGIQSIGAVFVKRIIGDYYNVVGLPVSRVVRALKEISFF